jgi:deazaflavin-dependent oxidoreductase (nitroreductase family)
MNGRLSVQVVEVVNKQWTQDPKIRQALSRGGVIDITTVGRQTGQPRRIEIVFHNIDGRIYISGIPRARRRGWLVNLEANPRFTLHLKGAVSADLPATARIITDEDERRATLAPIAKTWKRKDLEQMVRQSPLIEVTLDSVPAELAS